MNGNDAYTIGAIVAVAGERLSKVEASPVATAAVSSAAATGGQSVAQRS